MWKSVFRQNYYRTSFSPTVPPFAARISQVVADGGTWRLKWERLKAEESNGKLPPRTCPGCSVPEPYRSHDWALVPAKPGLQGWILMNDECYIYYWHTVQNISTLPEKLHVKTYEKLHCIVYCSKVVNCWIQQATSYTLINVKEGVDLNIHTA